MSLLEQINGPEDLHGLSEQELAGLAQEVREHIIDTVGEIGGHFGANLGTCELAVALHSLLDSPRDKILWDVGHQAYPHKILTGRREQLGTIRQYGGLAPFCSIGESPHDIMGAGHASTSIGYAVGIKEGMRHTGADPDAKVVAVIGDGAMTGGVAFEAIGQAGGLGTPIVVVLNDNGMSIAPNVGALSRYFNRIRLNPELYRAREAVETGLTKIPAGIGERFERLGPQLKESIKAFWAPGLFFEELDLAYVGVVDGHDVAALRASIGEALKADRPVVVHVRTVKGKGFAPAEEGGLEGMEKWHAAKPASIVDRKAAPKKAPSASPDPAPPQYTTVFGTALVEECRRDPRGEAEGVPMPSQPGEIEVGRGEVLREGDRVALLGYGLGVPLALRTAALLADHDLDVTVADARFAKPLDAELVATLVAEHEVVMTIEDGVLQGGFGSAVAEHLVDRDLAAEVRLLRAGLPDRYVTHGKPALLHKEVGLTAEALADRVAQAVGSRSGSLV